MFMTVTTEMCQEKNLQPSAGKQSAVFMCAAWHSVTLERFCRDVQLLVESSDCPLLFRYSSVLSLSRYPSTACLCIFTRLLCSFSSALLQSSLPFFGSQPSHYFSQPSANVAFPPHGPHSKGFPLGCNLWLHSASAAR